MDTADALNIANRLLHTYGLDQDGWRVVLDNAKRRAGQCRRQKKEIGLTASYVRLNGEDAVMDTILHEIAHALTPGAGHGPEWVAKAREMGCTGERCTEKAVTAEKGRYEARCEKGGHVVANYFRRPGAGMLARGFCKRHKVRVTWIDTRTNTLMNDTSAVAVFATAAQKPKTRTSSITTVKPWNAGATSWDEMWGEG